MYSFVIMIVVNFALFVFIAAGQVSIYWSVRSNRMAPSETTRKSKDLVIARRLLVVVMSDFLCWFPVGFLGLLASEGTPIPGEVNVALAIIALPVNSALNPFLYTLNVVLERRRRAREVRKQNVALSTPSTCTTNRREAKEYTADEAVRIFRQWMVGGKITRQDVDRAVADFDKSDICETQF
nr:hypothetical protein BaRGS_009737 [Batillaria attramentaria]